MQVSLTAILVVAGVALAFSGLDVVRKLLGDRYRPLPLLVLLTAGSLPIFLLWASSEGNWEIRSGYLTPALVSIVLNVFANLAFLQALRVSPLSVTIPYLSLTPVFTTLLAIPILGEKPSSQQIVGIVLVVIGAFWLNVRGLGGVSPAKMWRALLEEKGSVLMIGTALCWSLAAPLDKLAVTAASPAIHGVILMSGVTLGAIGILIARGELGEVRVQRSSLGLLGGAIGLTAVGAALNFFAFTLVWVGFIETFKRALGSVLALVWGRLIFAESIALNQVLAVVLMGFGVGLVVW